MFSKELESVKEAFFEAMQHGWASGNDGKYIRGRPGWKQIIHITSDKRHRVVDRWGRDPATNESTGSVLITTMEGIPEWVMWFGESSYQKRAIGFLRYSLLLCYAHKIFCGGRGPANVEDGEFIYINNYEGDFLKFKGKEFGYDSRHGTVVGCHRYWGGSLLHLV